MAHYEKIKGLPVIAMAEGKKLGRIDELVTDPHSKQVRWLRIRSGGALSPERRWVPVEAVHALGEHAVTINAESDVRSFADAQEAEDLAKSKRVIVGTKALTESGEYLGQVRDYSFAADTFELTDVNIGRGPFGQLRSIPADQVMTIGQDVTILKAGAARELAERETRAETRQAELEPPAASHPASEHKEGEQETRV